MKVQILRKDKLFYMKDRGRTVPITREAYFMAVRDKISMVKESGDHSEFPYSEMMELLEGICDEEC